MVIVCPAFPFGERDLAPTPTGRFIVEALAGRVPGYPEGGFCAVDVDDVAECQVLAEEQRPARRALHRRGNHNVTYRDFYDAVTRIAGLRPIRRRLPTAAVLAMAWGMERWAERTGWPPRVTVRAARYASETVWFDCRKARALGMPRTPLEVTIEKAVRWFRDHGAG